MNVSRAWNAYSQEVGRSQVERIRRLDALASFLDNALVLPGTNIRIGLDAVIGLIPGIGDVIMTVTSLYIVHEAWRLGTPNHLIARMLGNIAIDGLAGSIPLVGDVFDTFWRSNRRNMDLLQRHLRRRGAQTEYQ